MGPSWVQTTSKNKMQKILSSVVAKMKGRMVREVNVVAKMKNYKDQSEVEKWLEVVVTEVDE